MQDRQLLERPKHLTWEEAACYTLVLATSYRMLFGHRPHTLKPVTTLWCGAEAAAWLDGGELGASAGANAMASSPTKTGANT